LRFCGVQDQSFLHKNTHTHKDFEPPCSCFQQSVRGGGFGARHMARPRKKKRLTCAQNLAKGHAEIAREKGLGGHGGEQASAPQEEIQSSASNVSTVPPDATTEGGEGLVLPPCHLYGGCSVSCCTSSPYLSRHLCPHPVSPSFSALPVHLLTPSLSTSSHFPASVLPTLSLPLSLHASALCHLVSTICTPSITKPFSLSVRARKTSHPASQPRVQTRTPSSTTPSTQTVG